MAFGRQSGAPVHVVHLSSADALRETRSGRAHGVRVSVETCPHYLVLTEERYADPDPVGCARFMIAPPLRSADDADALWTGLADGSIDMVVSDHVPDRLAVEKAEAANGIPFNQISNGAPGIGTLLTLLYSEGVARGRISLERLVDLLATTPARRFGFARKGALEVGRDADIVLFDPAARRTIRNADLRHSSDYTPYEGMEVSGAVRDVFVRGVPVVRAGIFVGSRGAGTFQERAIATPWS
jgi:dihydropyrimidinase